MKIRTEWVDNSTTAFNDLFYTKEETVSSVVENFNYRRNYSAEGYSVTIDNITEQVIIQDHTNPINASKTDKKMLISMDSKVKTGSYVVFRNETWMINSRVNIVDDAYKSCQIYKCNWILKWQKADGTILSYPCINQSQSSLGGEEESKTITLGDTEHLITLPFDENTVLIRSPQRFFLDKHPTAPTPYKTVQNNNTEYEGLVKITIDQDELKGSTIDRVDLGICDYFIPKEEPHQSGISFYSILKSSSTNNTLTLGSKSGRTVTATLYDDENTINTTVPPIWNIEYPVGFENQFTKTDVNANKIKLVVAYNMKLLNKEVKISVSDGNGSYLSNVLTMKIVAGV